MRPNNAVQRALLHGAADRGLGRHNSLGASCPEHRKETVLREEGTALRDEIVEYATSRTVLASPPGLVLVSVSADGEDHLCNGTLALDRNEPPSLDTLFEIGSSTKVFVGLALAQLVDSGVVRLTDPAQSFLPTSVSLPTRGKQHIKLVDLATHTAALPRMPDDFDYTNPWASFKDYGLGDLYSFLGRVPLNWDIGTSSVYSNVGYALLGHILERITNRPYDALIVELVCQPLGMHQTGVSLPPNVGPLTKSYQGRTEVQPVEFGALGPAGGLRSTARDLIRFIKANLGLVETQLDGVLRSATEIHFSESDLSHVGLGWHVQSRNGKTLVWHRGETLGQTSFIGFETRRNAGVVMLSNSAFGGCCCDLAVSQLDETVLPRERQKTAEVALSPSDLKRFEGQYAFQPQVSMSVTANADHLRVEIEGQKGGSMYSVAPDEFITRDQRIRIRFVEEDGEMLGFRLTQHGMDRFVYRTFVS